MTTAAERGRANVARGKEAERQVARFLSVALGYTIIRHVRAGHARAGDPGDLKLDERLICSVKDDLEVYRLPTWMDELDAMDGPDTAIRFLVLKWRQHPVVRWHVYIRAGILAPLLDVDPVWPQPRHIGGWAYQILHTDDQVLRIPVRVELGAWTSILLRAGYGEATPEEAL